MNKIKKSIALVLVSLLTVGIMAGCGKGAASADSSLDNVKKAGTLTIGIDNTYPPMEFKDNSGNTVGFDIDIANAVGKKLGVKIKFQPTAWDGIFLALNSKRFDVIHSSVSVTDTRKKTMIFSKPYIYGGNSIFLKIDNNSIKGQKDLTGKVVGVQAGTTGQEVVEKMTGLKDVKKYDAMTDAFLDLQNGRIEAIVSDPQVGDYYIANQKDKFKRIKAAVNQEPEAVAFRKADVTLRDAYDKALDDLKADGTLTKLSEKWFGYDMYKK